MKSTNRRRRENGEGSISRLSDGSFRARVTLADGRRKAFYGRDRDEVLGRMHDALAQQRQGRLVIESGMKLRAYLEWWLDDVKGPSLSYNTAQSYANQIKRVGPPLANVQLRNLTVHHLQTWMGAEGKAGQAPATIRKSVQVVRQALDYAVKTDMIRFNPTLQIERPNGQGKEMHYLTEEQARLLLVSTVGQPDHALWALMISAGLRISEALGLCWTDIDCDAATVMVNHTLEARHGEERGYFLMPRTKTKAGVRRVDVDQEVIAALRSWRAKQAAMRLAAGSAWADNGFVFSTKNGRPRDRSGAARSLTRAIQAANLPGLTPHGLRHTCATILMDNGMPDKMVAEWLGHTSTKMTDRYQHVQPNMQREAAKIIGDAIWGQKHVAQR
jgi:integrase